ncbi:MAG: DUF1887 family protein [Ruminococcaceae bacterium]|nr:DUF1887 family protein [Oscillospiraceae bacterium]
MTLIEIFETCQLDNIATGLRLGADKIIFLGFKKVMSEKRRNSLENFIKLKGLDIQLEYQPVSASDYGYTFSILQDIVSKNPECCLDITGGEEILLAAMGAVSAQNNIPMVQMDVRSGRMIPIAFAESIPQTEKSQMTIEESIVLNGGLIVNDENDFEWNLTEDFKADIETMWNICKSGCGYWNRQCTSFYDIEQFTKPDDVMFVYIDLEFAEKKGLNITLNPRIMDALINAGLIYDYMYREDNVLSFRYKNEQVYQCLTKAGNILELYAYVLLNEISAQQPGYYDDVDIGIYVDWDGVIQDTTMTRERDTRNEIDIMLMRDIVPVFISCKNGEVKKEALYELNTMAQHFGGKYAKKIMLATYMSGNEQSKKYIKRRADDMNIDIIDGIETMTREEFKQKLITRVK